MDNPKASLSVPMPDSAGKESIKAQKNGNISGKIAQQLKEKAEKLGIFFLEKAPKNIDRDSLIIIPEELCKKHQIAVFEKVGNTVKVAMVDPENFEALNVLRFIAKKNKWKIEIYLATPEIFDFILSQYAGAEKTIEEAIRSVSDEDLVEIHSERSEKGGKEDVIQDAPIIKLVQVIIRRAIDEKASDIHIEPFGSVYRVRLRVDGVLSASLSFPKGVGKAVISRIKIVSNLKIDERRKPQDGRFSIIEGSKKVDFRVSTLPVVEGEKVVMRVLSKEEGTFDLKKLGLFGRNAEVFLREIREPYGIILMSGPTGSGKSTTLYAFLKILNQEERNIVTLEDPVEYFMDGINQSQVKPEIGYDFANGLRSILRQDPNVIMVGEIRDGETAELAIHAALTGHLVFSTLHTNDAVGAIPRLIDMGVEPFLLSSSLRAVAAQRLVRRICLKCKEEVKISPAVSELIKKEIEGISAEEMQKYGLDLSQGIKTYKGRGCEECNKTGYKGRVAIIELVDSTPAIQELIASSDKTDNEQLLRKEAKNQGMIRMKQDGILKVLVGTTTLSEVERVTDGSITAEEENAEEI